MKNLNDVSLMSLFSVYELSGQDELPHNWVNGRRGKTPMVTRCCDEKDVSKRKLRAIEDVCVFLNIIRQSSNLLGRMVYLCSHLSIRSPIRRSLYLLSLSFIIFLSRTPAWYRCRV